MGRKEYLRHKSCRVKHCQVDWVPSEPTSDGSRAMPRIQARGDRGPSRNQSREYDVSKILNDCASKFPEGLGKGHKAAAGGQIRIEDLEGFKKELKEYNIENAQIN